MAGRGHGKLVGRKIRITAEYFDDVSDVDVESDFEYETEITRHIRKGRVANHRVVFDDHTGVENYINIDTALGLLIEEDDNEEEAAPGNPRGK